MGNTGGSMNNLLKQLSIIVAELLASKEFWKELLLCTETKHNVLFPFEASCGKIVIKFSLCDAMEWLIYFGRSENENDLENWQKLLRKDLLRYMIHPHNLRNDKIIVPLDSRNFGELIVTFIPKESELYIHLEAEEASCDKGGDGYGRD